jgi:isoaspartyl peptidase/L-asparaginase-like protein (Ntn-hydrolase superfamily)
MNRRVFFKRSTLVTAGFLADQLKGAERKSFPFKTEGSGGAIIISTWNFGKIANEEAWTVTRDNGSSLDAVERGIRIIERDPANHSVGYGGFPDRDGHVTLDACIMDSYGRAGSVAFLEGIMHPISVARLVMEKTPHVMLAGNGALQFALENGFQETNLLTEESKKAWEIWKEKENYQPVINIEEHDTIGLLCMDMKGNIAGGCSTSGLAYKMHGRVGDSPIIGAALYVDNDIGAAVTTGLGEMVMRSVSSFLAVELMRNGASPQAACEEAVLRIVEKNPEHRNNQVGILTLSKSGETGGFSVQPGFNYALTTNDRHEIIRSPSYM